MPISGSLQQRKPAAKRERKLSNRLAWGLIVVLGVIFGAALASSPALYVREVRVLRVGSIMPAENKLLEETSTFAVAYAIENVFSVTS